MSERLEGGARFRDIFAERRPNIVALFSERVPMVKGRWDPSASTATSYAWCIWHKGLTQGATYLDWIPPGTRARLWRADDIARFTPSPAAAVCTPASTIASDASPSEARAVSAVAGVR